MSSNFKRIKHRGGVSALAERVKTPGTVDVGVIDAGPHESGDLTVAEIGFNNEYGVGVPERPFMRGALKDQRKTIRTLSVKYVKMIQDGDLKTEDALGLLGEFMADKIKRKIVAIRTPPNSPRTIARKGSSNPLIDTGQLKNSITYEVNR